MDTITEMIKEATKVIEFRDRFNMSEADYQRIEAALIKYADELRMAN
jgi:uncharacterized protein (DUF1778 family)